MSKAANPLSFPDPEGVPQEETPWVGHLLLAGTGGILLFAVLAFGAVEPWSLLALRASACALLLGWSVFAVIKPTVRLYWHPALLPLVLFGLLVLAQVLLGISNYPYATRSELLNFVCYVMLFFVSVQVLNARSRRVWFAFAIVVFGLLMAVFAIAQDLTSDGLLYWVRQPRQGGWVFGPYVNHNHYAGLVEMLLPFPILFALFTRFRVEQRALCAFVAGLLLVSVFMSESRGGALAVFVQIGLILLISLRRQGIRRHAVLYVVGLLVISSALLMWLGGTKYFDRVATLKNVTSDQVVGGRWTIARDSVTMISERPILGWGLGVFPVAYPSYRSRYTDAFVNQAHNDILQALVETGIVGFSLLGWAVWYLYRDGLTALVDWQSSLSGTIGTAALIACTGLLVHSWIDFNLHIPANAAFFAVLCALVLARPHNAAIPRPIRAVGG